MGYINKAIDSIGVIIGGNHAAFFTSIIVAENFSVVTADYDEIVSGDSIKLRNIIV